MDLIKKELKNKYPNCRIKLELSLKTPKTIIYHYIINSHQGYQVAMGSAILKGGNITINQH